MTYVGRKSFLVSCDAPGKEVKHLFWVVSVGLEKVSIGNRGPITIAQLGFTQEHYFWFVFNEESLEFFPASPTNLEVNVL